MGRASMAVSVDLPGGMVLRQGNYSRNLLITGRSPPQVCKYSALKPSNENSNTGDLVKLNKQKLKH